MTRFTVRIPADRLLPTVEVALHGDAVYTARGITYASAMRRAIKWMRAHGDPR